ncbi:MAG: hypothetical protein CL678_18715 [Bdellovibrionaceae bacterium]|nr:hypothetical protein [Pseudobdellovibrionaceae bacterium]
MEDAISSWIYLFSHFTPEAILIETALICIFIGVYAVFWVNKKRKVGSMKDTVPAGVIQVYLNELIGDAHELRSQLFGLLSQMGVTPRTSTPQPTPIVNPSAEATDAPMPTAVQSDDPELQKKLDELFKKVSAQENSLAQLNTEKLRLEEELKNAKASAGGEGAPAGGNEDLENKIKELESRLSEYSVIEDDLANLKQLQQENESLKNALQQKGGELPVDQAPSEPAAEESTQEASSEETTEPGPESESEEPAADFEGLVDAVEESLEEKPAEEAPQEATADEPEATSKEETQEETPAQEAAADKPEPAAGAESQPEETVEASSEPSPLENVGSSDEDLLSEFEKMLNG